MSLFTAVITFFLLILILMSIKENVYYILLIAFMGMFISFNIPALFNSGVAFSSTFAYATGPTQEFWLQLMYGMFTLIAFGRAAINAYGKRPSMEAE